MAKKGFIIPHEHGGWAMVSVPFIIGMMASNPQWLHLLLFLAWLFLYLASYPLLQAVKKRSNRGRFIQWGIIYGVIALLCVILPLYKYPVLFYFSIPFLSLLVVNIWHAKQRSERQIVNDLSAILIFSLGGAAAYLVGDGTWDYRMIMVILFNFLYFTGTVFFVKSVFRERGNARWLAANHIYHVILMIAPWLVGMPWMMLSYACALVRSFVYGGKQMRPMKVGIIEIVSVLFFLIVAVIVI
ncbi:YwiC-like family protein [Paenibacillus sp. CMAA1364]